MEQSRRPFLTHKERDGRIVSLILRCQPEHSCLKILGISRVKFQFDDTPWITTNPNALLLSFQMGATISTFISKHFDTGLGALYSGFTEC